MSAGAVSMGLAATAARTSSSAGSLSGTPGSAPAGSADDAASPSFADMLDKAAPTVSGTAHGSPAASEKETSSGHSSSDTAGDAPPHTPAPSGSAAHPSVAKRSVPGPSATPSDRTTPAPHPETSAVAGPAPVLAGADRVTVAARPTPSTKVGVATPAADAHAPAAVIREVAIHGGTASSGAPSSPAGEGGPGAEPTAADRGAPRPGAPAGETVADPSREATTGPEVAAAEAPGGPATAPSAATTPRAVAPKSSASAHNPSAGAAPTDPSATAPSSANLQNAPGAPAPAADERQGMTRPIHSSDNGSAAAPVAASPAAAASAAAPLSASSRPAQSSAGVEVHFSPLDDSSLPQPGFVGGNPSLTAAISAPRNLGDGVYQLHAALSPPALGQVDATVKVDGTNVEVVLVAHTAEGHQQLAANLDQLRQALSPGGGGDLQLTLADRGRQGTPQQPGAGSSAPDAAPDPDLPLEHLLVATPAAPARSSLHIIL